MKVFALGMSRVRLVVAETTSLAMTIGMGSALGVVITSRLLGTLLRRLREGTG